MKSPFTPAGKNPKGSFARIQLARAMELQKKQKAIETAEGAKKRVGLNELVQAELEKQEHSFGNLPTITRAINAATNNGERKLTLGELVHTMASGETDAIKVLGKIKIAMSGMDLILPKEGERHAQQELTFNPLASTIESAYFEAVKQFGEGTSALMHAIEGAKYKEARRLIEQRIQQAKGQ